MHINEMTMEQIEARMNQIRTEMDAPGADIDALTEEVRKMNERKEEIRTAEKKKAELRKAVAGGTVGTTIHTFEQHREEERTMGVESKEYRNAWLRNMQGKELSPEETRAYTVSGGAIATMTANAILTEVRNHAPLLAEITVIYSAEKITYYAEKTTVAAEDHTENAVIKAAADDLEKIELTPGEITKLVQISAAASAMSVDAFEAWLAETLGEAIARKINEKIIAAAMAAAASAGTSITDATVRKMLGLVKGKTTVVCNNNTLFNALLPLQDNSKSSIVKFDGGQATLYGRKVEIDDEIADNQILAGNLPKAVAAMAEDVAVKKQFDIDSNSNKYLGVALFDVKIGVKSAFAKIVVG